MPLILDPESHREAVLTELARELRADLVETRESVLHPRGRVLDPASLETARELVDAALARIGPEAARTRADMAADANLAYATMLAVIDLVKSHTDVPRVPASQKKAGAGAP